MSDDRLLIVSVSSDLLLVVCGVVLVADILCYTGMSCFLFSYFVVHYKVLIIIYVPTGTPRHIDYASVLEDLQSIDGVRLAHSLYIWSLTLNKSALAAHLAVGEH